MSRTEASAETPARSGSRLPRNVIALGVVSFLNDVSSEMIYPLVPIFLTAVLGAPVAALGVIEGIAESTASLLKLASGWWSDRARKRLPLVVAGYGLGVVGKILLALAYAWPMVLAGRFVDRVGKGTRGSPRDALIADSTPPALRGRAFGLHRSMDTAGAVVGPLLGLGLVAVLNDRLRLVFVIAAVPGLVGMLALSLVREVPRHEAERASSGPRIARFGELDRRLLIFLAASLLFALGNSSDVFLLLRAKDLGLSTTLTVLAYVVYNFVYMACALPAGIVSDRIGRRGIFTGGLLIFAFVYTGFAFATATWVVWPLFAVYGLYMALTDGVGKALLTDLAPIDLRASVLGLYGMITGIAALFASVVAGVLWDDVSIAAPFAMGAGAALIAALLLAVAGGRLAPAQKRKPDLER